MDMRTVDRKALPVLALAAVLPALASRAAEPPAAGALHDIPPNVMTSGFLAGHPDLRFRKAGMEAERQGNPAAARDEYRRAAHYGDKPSQGRLGEMYWQGEGGGVDRVAGFLWMSLAAERGYTFFQERRMAYWKALTPAEQAQARSRDQSMLSGYGDAVAKPRQAMAMLHAGARRSTGSLLGYGGQKLVIELPGGGSVDAGTFYAPEFWQPDRYWQMQDRLWDGRSPGRVEVGEPEDLDSHAHPRADGRP